MKNYRLALTLLALIIISSIAFTTANDGSTEDVLNVKTSSGNLDTTLSSSNSVAKKLPPQREIEVNSVQELMWTVDTCKDGNVTILIADGTYTIPNSLWITAENITYKSKSGNRDKVILKGDFKTSHIFWIASDYVTIQDLSIGQVNDNGIQILGEKDADFALIKNVRFFDIKEQMLKSSGAENNIYSDYTRIEDCLFEFTSGVAYQSYTGGIDVAKATNWVVTNNTFKNIQYPKGKLTEGAIRFGEGSSGTLISKNTIIQCDWGIILGSDDSRHDQGTLTDNVIETTREVGIALCNATGTTVKGNQIKVPATYPNAIEYRFKTEGTVIENNTVNQKITSRNGGNAKVGNNGLFTPVSNNQ